jgi:putative phage-type endonuclease
MEGYIDRGTYYELIYPPRTPEWEKARQGKVTATGASAVSGRSRFMSREAYKHQIINNTKIDVNDDMRRGIELEPTILAEYCKVKGYKIRQPSFCLSKIIPDIGATPDAIVLNSDGTDSKLIVECKAPRTIKEFIYDAHVLQMQFQMFVVGATSCDYVQYADGRIDIRREEFDEVKWGLLQTCVEDFLVELKQ